MKTAMNLIVALWVSVCWGFGMFVIAAACVGLIVTLGDGEDFTPEIAGVSATYWHVGIGSATFVIIAISQIIYMKAYDRPWRLSFVKAILDGIFSPFDM